MRRCEEGGWGKLRGKETEGGARTVPGRAEFLGQQWRPLRKVFYSKKTSLFATFLGKGANKLKAKNGSIRRSSTKTTASLSLTRLAVVLMNCGTSLQGKIDISFQKHRKASDSLSPQTEERNIRGPLFLKRLLSIVRRTMFARSWLPTSSAPCLRKAPSSSAPLRRLGA